MESSRALEITDRKRHVMCGYLNSHGICSFIRAAMTTILVHHTHGHQVPILNQRLNQR